MIPNLEPRSNRGAELLGLLAFALSLMLLIALATFDPRDPASFFKAGAEMWARFGYTTAQDGGSTPGSVAAMRQVAAQAI